MTRPLRFVRPLPQSHLRLTTSVWAMPFRPALPMNRAVLRRLGLSVGIAIALAGCNAPPEELAWYDQPNDPQVYAFTLHKCLAETRGPNSTTYNDWDEAIQACGQQAGMVSRYCPQGARCKSGSSSHAEVRSVLASAMSASGQDGETRLEAKPASAVPQGDAR
jgi:hypothetical protein